MENLEIYNKLRECPTEAIKPINAGRLKGMSNSTFLRWLINEYFNGSHK